MKTSLLTGTVAAALMLNLALAPVVRAQSPEPSATPSKPAAEVSPSPSAAPTASVSSAEAPMRKKMLERYDVNKDGVLDPTEKAAMEKDREARRAAKLKKFDKNGDGKLDDEERAAMRDSRGKDKVKDQEK